MHKAIAVIQFKLEGGIIDKHPEWNLFARKLLDKMDAGFANVTIGGASYPMLDSNFPTIDPADPLYALTEEERILVEKLHRSFAISDKAAPPHQDILLLTRMHVHRAQFQPDVPRLGATQRGRHPEGDRRDGTPLQRKELLHNIGMLIRSAFDRDTDPVTKRIRHGLYMVSLVDRTRRCSTSRR